MPSRPETDAASADYAAALLADLGAPAMAPPAGPEEHPALAWANCGAMALTGLAEGPPLVAPAFLPAAMRGAVLALKSLSGAGLEALGDPAALLGERAACAGLSRQGAASPGGACRFVRAADGWVAVNLPRPDDFDLLPALIEEEAEDGWTALERAAPRFAAADLAARGRLLGLALAREGEVEAGAWFESETMARAPAAARSTRPLVLDFSSLWAGPLCGHVLSLLGARVVKVESASRPDGARGGPPAFFDLMNGGKESAAVDFRTAEGRDQLRRLIARADIVIDSARPRAWTQLGLEPAQLIAANPRLTWLSLTGHGRGEPEAAWPGFGDDAAAAAGASLIMPRPGGAPVFVADALGDPLTGLHGALAAWAAHLAGGGRLVGLALSKVTAYALAFRRADDPAGRRADWTAWLAERGIAARAPSARSPGRAARAPGADNAAVLELLGAPC
jgi:hypothetical protein